MVVLWCRLGLGCRSNTSRARGGDARANLGNKKLMLGELGKRLKGTTTFLLLRHKFSCMEPGFRKFFWNSCTQTWSCRGEYFGPHIISCLRDEENGLAAKASKLFLAECELGVSSASSKTLLCFFPPLSYLIFICLLQVCKSYQELVLSYIWNNFNRILMPSQAMDGPV